jgi:GxxExxY protein
LGIHARQQVKLPFVYEGQQVWLYFTDLWIENYLIVEIKAILTLAPAHETKLIHYLTATGIDDGLLINFGETVQVKRKYRQQKPAISS